MKGIALCLALLAGRLLAAPPNDDFANAQALAGNPISIASTTTDATAEPGEPNHDLEIARASVWFKWTPSQSGYATVSTAGSDYDTILAIYTGTSLLNLSSVASNDDNGGATSKVSFVANGDVTYFLAVDGYQGDTGNLNLTLNFIGGITSPPNDFYANAAPLTTFPVSITTSNFLATTETGELTPVNYGGASLWWTWQAPATGHYIISTAGTDFDTILSLYKYGSLTAWNDDTATNKQSVLRIYARVGALYHISVQGYRNAMGVIQLSLTADPHKPAAPWTLQDIDGQTLHASDFLGKVVIIDLWATWCQPCIDEIPNFVNMQDKYGPDGLVIIGVSTDPEGESIIRPILNDYSVNYYSTLVTPDFAQNYGPLEFIPSAYIINRQGMITDKFIGVHPQKTLEDAFTPLLYDEIPLLATREGSNIVLRWAASSKGFILQASPAMSPPIFGNLQTTITVSGEYNVARIPISGDLRYFRLVHN